MNILRKILMVLLPLAVIAAGALAAFALIQSRQEPEKAPPQVEPPLVRVMEAKPKTVRLTVQAEGTITPRTESQLVSEVSGRVVAISPSLAAGGFFDKDEVVLRIDPREYELAVVRARAAVAQAKLRVATEEQEAEVARREWEDLGQGEASPLVLREPQLAEAQAELASAEAALAQAEYDLERTVLRAPYASRVREKSVDVGQYVQKGAMVARIYSTDIAEVRLPIPDADLAYVDLPLAYRDAAPGKQPAGPRVTLHADFGGRTYQWRGRIVRTEGEIDPQTQMVQAVAQVADPYLQTGRAGRPPLAVGMFVEAEIQGRAVRAIEVPRSALRGENTALVVNEQDEIEFRELDLLRSSGESVLVRGGLEAGERVCVSNLETAVNGMPVRVLEETAANE